MKQYDPVTEVLYWLRFRSLCWLFGCFVAEEAHPYPDWCIDCLHEGHDLYKSNIIPTRLIAKFCWEIVFRMYEIWFHNKEN